MRQMFWKPIANFLWILSTRGTRRLKRFFDFRRFLFTKVGEGTIISPYSYIPDPYTISLGNKVLVEDYCALISERAQIIVGDRTMLSSFARIQAIEGCVKLGADCTLQQYSIISGYKKGIEIGDGVRIGAHSLIIGSNHNFQDLDIPIWKQGSSSEGIVIQDDVWIGSNVTILDGIQISKGSVIAAGAVVTKSVPAYSIMAGVPAEIIRKR